MSLNDEAAKLREEGNAFVNEKNYTKAIECYTKSLELNKKCDKSLANRSYAWLQIDRYYDAFMDASQALKLNKGYTKARYRKALALSKLGDNGKAARNIIKCIAIEETNEKFFELLRRTNEGLSTAVNDQANFPMDTVNYQKNSLPIRLTIIGSGSKSNDPPHIEFDFTKLIYEPELFGENQYIVVCEEKRAGLEATFLKKFYKVIGGPRQIQKVELKNLVIDDAILYFFRSLAPVCWLRGTVYLEKVQCSKERFDQLMNAILMPADLILEDIGSGIDVDFSKMITESAAFRHAKLLTLKHSNPACKYLCHQIEPESIVKFLHSTSLVKGLSKHPHHAGETVEFLSQLFPSDPENARFLVYPALMERQPGKTCSLFLEYLRGIQLEDFLQIFVHRFLDTASTEVVAYRLEVVARTNANITQKVYTNNRKEKLSVRLVDQADDQTKKVYILCRF